MKRTILSLAFAGSMLLAASACNSTKNVSGSSDSTEIDSTSITPAVTDTAVKDTAKTTPPDTTKTP
ncbi:coproporphyrinogen III oxidase [Pedobacter sp. MC2016-15]|uniref:coproporphyrinogen III oxidase n=1 Tax=Pedobacter sp. MC2016-15 TaxID=2994473 RepID=UPI002245A163|nr:coproporphyrinogen III oxidase [Pedobacter sp. MC2016-15]MCX2477515.1 coproporphyrinogen III oxidase [Pedobacter sp. MC2016-15]